MIATAMTVTMLPTDMWLLSINSTNTWGMPVLDSTELPALGHLLLGLHCWVHAAHVSSKHVKLHTRHIYSAPNLYRPARSVLGKSYVTLIPTFLPLPFRFKNDSCRWNVAVERGTRGISTNHMPLRHMT